MTPPPPLPPTPIPCLAPSEREKAEAIREAARLAQRAMAAEQQRRHMEANAVHGGWEGGWVGGWAIRGPPFC